MASTGWTELPRVWLVTRGAQSVGERPEVRGLVQSPIWGLGRVLSEEQPALWGGQIDLDPEMPNSLSARLLFDEINQPDGEDQLAYRADQRFAARLVKRADQQGSPQRLRWRTDATYLVSGGLGDLGLEVARWMARQGARHLLLFGRSPFPARAQ